MISLSSIISFGITGWQLDYTVHTDICVNHDGGRWMESVQAWTN